MTIAIDLTATSAASADRVFATVALLREWDEYAGVRLRGVDDRPIELNDQLEIAIDVAGRTIGVTCVVDRLEPPSLDAVSTGRVHLRTIAGAVDGEIEGSVRPIGEERSELRLTIDGRARGAVRLVEAPLERIGRRWVAHQIAHLATAAQAAPSS